MSAADTAYGPEPGDDLAALRLRLADCRHCEAADLIPEARPVFQLPDQATIGLFSQAPGNLAHHGGRPFMDPSGVRLRAWMGMTEAEFYESGRLAIAPMAFCFPGYDGKGPTGKGGDRPPPKACAAIWREAVMATLPPLRLVLLVGTYAQAWHLGPRRGASLADLVGTWRARMTVAQDGAPVVLPLPHPSWRNNAWLKANPWFESELVPDLQRLVRQALNARTAPRGAPFATSSN